MIKEPFSITPSEEAKLYYPIINGSTEGQIVGGNLNTFNLLQGTPFMPDLENKIIIIEDNNLIGDYFPYVFDRNLQSLAQTSAFSKVKGIVIGRFNDSCTLDLHTITQIIKSKEKLLNIPVVFNVDFGHMLPMATFPIGGTVKLNVSEDKVSIEVIQH